MVCIVDLLRRGDEHGNINIPIIRALIKHQILNHVWISDDSTSNKYFSDEDKNLITPIKVLPTKKYKWINSTLFTIKILFFSRIKKTEVFFLSATPLQNLIITLFSIFQSRDVRHYILLHGELSYLVNPVGLGRRLGKLFLNVAFKILPFSNTTQVTLAYPVFAALKSRYKVNDGLINLEMPSESNNDTPVIVKTSRKLRIGSFGVHSVDKSSHLIYQLANILEGKRGQIEIVTIGVASSDFKYDQHPMVEHYCRGALSNALIPRDLFIEEIKKLDFALFFYGENPQYEMVSSGAFIDCVNYEIPFAALSSGYFNHYIEKYGQIGFVRDNLVKLADELIDISNNVSIIQTYKNNLKMARKDRSLERFESQLMMIFKGSFSDVKRF